MISVATAGMSPNSSVLLDASCMAVTHAPGYANCARGSARPSTTPFCDLNHKMAVLNHKVASNF